MEYFKRDMREEGKENTRLVGAEVPTDTFYYLNLFCVVDKRSKSSVLRPLVEKWAKKAKKSFPEKKLIELAAEIGYANYKNRGNKKTPFKNVLKIQERELERRGIDKEVIQKIIKKIEDVKNKEDKES